MEIAHTQYIVFVWQSKTLILHTFSMLFKWKKKKLQENIYTKSFGYVWVYKELKISNKLTLRIRTMILRILESKWQNYTKWPNCNGCERIIIIGISTVNMYANKCDIIIANNTNNKVKWSTNDTMNMETRRTLHLIFSSTTNKSFIFICSLVCVVWVVFFFRWT